MANQPAYGGPTRRLAHRVELRHGDSRALTKRHSNAKPRAVLKATVDYLLYWDATAAAESWARYVAENVADLEDIADGEQPSAESMAFLIRTQQICYVFGFEIINLRGNVQLTSDGSKISSIRSAVHSDTAARAAKSGQPIISVRPLST
jgi:hypothetical protein